MKICIHLQQKRLKSSESLQKTTYKTFKQFFIFSNCFWVTAVLNVKIEPKSCNKDWVLG